MRLIIIFCLVLYLNTERIEFAQDTNKHDDVLHWAEQSQWLLWFGGHGDEVFEWFLTLPSRETVEAEV